MAFPVVQARNETSFTAAATSFACNLPASIASGDLLIVILASGGTNAQQFNTLTGWTELVDENNTFGVHAWYRLADGTEGATVTFTCTGSSRAASVSYRISGAENPATQAPQISTVATGTSAAPDPGTLTPTGGAKDYLWLTFFANGSIEEADDDTWLNNAATNYSNQLAITSGTGGTNVAAILGSCERTANATSENAVWPASSTDASAAWRAFTIAVHPATAVNATVVAPAAAASGQNPLASESTTAGPLATAATAASVAATALLTLLPAATAATAAAPAPVLHTSATVVTAAAQANGQSAAPTITATGNVLIVAPAAALRDPLPRRYRYWVSRLALPLPTLSQPRLYRSLLSQRQQPLRAASRHLRRHCSHSLLPLRKRTARRLRLCLSWRLQRRPP